VKIRAAHEELGHHALVALSPGALDYVTVLHHKEDPPQSSDVLQGVASSDLPDGKGHAIISVMTNTLRETRQTAARFIAGVARTAYDHFAGGSAGNS